jgi:DNA helicase-2/ATP-dependent DNA helicase PcrA
LDERPEQLAGIRERFSHLVIDEYQDINDRQEQLIELISNAGTEVQVTAVGDDDQSIYSWRGAEVENILRFGERYPDVTPVTLDYNFRSTHAIVEIANRSIRQLPDDRRTAKEMEARHWNEENEEFEETMADEGDIQLRTFEGNPGDDRQQAKERAKRREAEWVADQIEELRGTIIREKDGSERAIDYADMAILLRTNSTGDDFASVLEERSIPYVVKGAGGLFDHDEAMLIQSGFALISRSNLLVKSEDDFIENEDLEDEDDDYAELTPEETREYVRELIERLQGAGAMPTANAGRFLEWVAEKREELDEISDEEDIRRIYPQDIFHEMLDVLGAADDTDPWPQQTLFNLGRVSDLITQYEAVHQWVQPDDLQYLCMFLGGWAASNADEGSLDEALTPNAVQILTVHKAKGLEWPAVFIPRVSSRKFPHQKRYQGQDTFLSNEVFDEDQYANGDEGERRLWYVALTRAQKFLNVTSIDVPYTRPTDYHEEIAHDYVQREGEVPPRRAGDPTRPATADLLPTTYSDLECYWRCPFEYQLRSLMDFSPGVEEAYGYGQQIHNVLNEIHQRALDGEEVDEEEARQLTEERFHLRYTSGDPFEELKESAKDAIGRYLTQYPESTEFVLRTEQPFEFVDDQSGALINGTIDLLERVEQTDSGEEEREPVAVIDFKTYSWGDYEEYIKRKRSVENQLRMYAIAVRQALGFDADEARAHILSPQGPPDELVKQGVEEQIDVDVSQPSLEATMERVRESIREIEYTIQNDDATFALRGVENGHCPDCDFNTFCPGYSRFQEQLDNE